MRSHELPIALLGFAAIVAVLPAWLHFSGSFDAPVGGHGFLAALVLPATILLYTVSWVHPAGSRLVLGGFTILACLVLAPTFWEMSGLAAGAATSNPLAETFVRLALPVVVLAALVSAGWIRGVRRRA